MKRSRAGVLGRNNVRRAALGSASCGLLLNVPRSCCHSTSDAELCGARACLRPACNLLPWSSMMRIVCSSDARALYYKRSVSGSHAHHTCALCFATKMRRQGLPTVKVLTLHCMLRRTRNHPCSGYVGRPIPRAAEHSCLAHDIRTKYFAQTTSNTFRPSRAF